jgi:hypothetical protein
MWDNDVGDVMNIRVSGNLYRFTGAFNNIFSNAMCNDVIGKIYKDDICSTS